MKWIFSEKFEDVLAGVWYEEYVSEDGKFVKQIFDDGSEDIFEIAD